VSIIAFTNEKTLYTEDYRLIGHLNIYYSVGFFDGIYEFDE